MSEILKNIKFNGVIKNKEDNRDYKIAQFIPRVDIVKDEEYCMALPSLDIILNQLSTGSCVAHSFAICLSILIYQATGKWIDFSPYMIYGTRYKEDDYDGVGMYPRQAAKVLKREGAYLRRDFKLEGEMPEIARAVEQFKKDHPKLVKKALDFTIDGYSMIIGNNQIKAAIKNGMPISATWDIYENFEDTKDDGYVQMPKGEYIGSHQMSIVGWTDKHWIVINSWGNDAGLKGMYLIPFGYMPENAIAITDKIMPIKNKAKNITLKIGSNYVMADGEEYQIDAPAVIKNNRTFVPARFVSEHLGASVEWVDALKKVIIHSEESDIELEIGSREYKYDDRVTWGDVAPYISNNRTLVPIRIIAEHLNCDVFWNDEKQIVSIKAL